ncbi:pentapeptide repeat-containing protein [Comamonas testosteroni]|uniref:pentapeptide repeat-containing protein n=1 Tax=Comamonas testosteroni TaxID=285 RepID=UPI00350E463C
MDALQPRFSTLAGRVCSGLARGSRGFGCRLFGGRLLGSRFFSGCRLAGCRLAGCRFAGCRFAGCRFWLTGLDRRLACRPGLGCRSALCRTFCCSCSAKTARLCHHLFHGGLGKTAGHLGRALGSGQGLGGNRLCHRLGRNLLELLGQRSPPLHGLAQGSLGRPLGLGLGIRLARGGLCLGLRHWHR